MIYAKAAFTLAYSILTKAHTECEKLKQSSNTNHTSEQIIQVYFNLSGLFFFFFEVILEWSLCCIHHCIRAQFQVMTKSDFPENLFATEANLIITPSRPLAIKIQMCVCEMMNLLLTGFKCSCCLDIYNLALYKIHFLPLTIHITQSYIKYNQFSHTPEFPHPTIKTFLHPKPIKTSAVFTGTTILQHWSNNNFYFFCHLTSLSLFCLGG